jgi:group I intron endonuclease
MAESGIYEIVNLVNGKRYVGSACEFQKRWLEHRRDLERGNHHSRALQRAWNKYGGSNFEFRVVENCSRDLLIVREQAAFDLLKPEYNACKVAGSSLGYRHTETARQNMAAKQRRRWDGISDEEKRRQAQHLISPEIQAKAAAARRGVKYRKRSPEHCRKISEAKRGKPCPKNVGRKASEECRRKIREARSRQVLPLDCGRSRANLTDDQVREIRQRRLAGEFCSDIGKDFGLRSSAVSRICLRQRYNWVDPDSAPISFPKKGRGGWKHKPGYRTGRRSQQREERQDEPSLFAYRSQKLR